MKDINWGKGLLSVIASVFITVAAGLLLVVFQAKEPSIVYSYEEILPFVNQTERLSIYHVTIENIGNDIASDLALSIKLNPAIIKEYRINSDSPIEFIENADSSGIKIETTTLNPSEKFRISIFASSKSDFPYEPQIYIRGKGFVGQRKVDADELTIIGISDVNIVRIMLMSLGALFTTSFLTLVFRRKLAIDDHQHRGDQNQIIAYLCGLHGLENQVDRYLTLPTQTTYWAEMDRLASLAIISNDSRLKTKVQTIISDLIEYAGMANTSRGIGYYNLARLEKSNKNDMKANEYIEMSNKIIPKLLSTRLKYDPLFRTS